MSLVLIISVFIVSAWMTKQFSKPSSKFFVLDQPNERSLHENPTPRSGGLAVFISIFVAGTILAFSVTDSSRFPWIGVAMILIAAISFIDDHHTVAAAYRFAVHVIASIIVIAGGFILDAVSVAQISWHMTDSLAVILTILFVVWTINLYNFMDGMDGFSGGMAVIGFLTMAFIGWQSDHLTFTVGCLIIVAAAGGFLAFNFPPARIFMGDVGSSVLGLLVATFSIWADNENIIPLWLSVLIFSPFYVDSTVTLIRRGFRRERIWEAHRTHYYQRLVQLGWGHKKTVLWEYVLMLLCAISAIIAVRLQSQAQWYVFIGWVFVYVVLALSISYLERHKSN